MSKAPRAGGSARREDKSVRLRLLLWAVLTALTFGVTDLGRPAEDMLRTGRNVLRQHDASGDIVVVALDDRREWYRYHHLFAEVLLAHATRADPGQVREHHRRASEWYERNGSIPDAINHAQRGADMDRLASLLERNWPAFQGPPGYESIGPGWSRPEGAYPDRDGRFVVLEDKFVKRKISLKFLEAKDPQPAGGSMFTMQVELKKGIDKDNARKLVALIKGEKSLKVTPSIQGDAVRVQGKKRDDLQAAIAILRRQEVPVVQHLLQPVRIPRDRAHLGIRDRLQAHALGLGRREDPEVRACAAMALGRIGTEGAMGSLRRAANEKEVLVRNAVSRSLRGGTA